MEIKQADTSLGNGEYFDPTEKCVGSLKNRIHAWNQTNLKNKIVNGQVNQIVCYTIIIL